MIFNVFLISIFIFKEALRLSSTMSMYDIRLRNQMYFYGKKLLRISINHKELQINSFSLVQP